MSIGYAYADAKESAIHIFESQIGSLGKHLTFDTAGKFIDVETLSEKNIGEPIFNSEKFNITKGSSNGKSNHLIYITDNNFNVTKSLFPIDSLLSKKESTIAIYASLINSSNHDIPIIGLSDRDTIYTLTDNKEIEPLVVLKKGKYSMPNEMLPKMMNPTLPYIQNITVNATQNHYLISYMFKGLFFFDVWQKSDQQLLARFDSSNREFGYKLALPSGKTIAVTPSYIDNDNIYFIAQAISLTGEIDGIEEDDNPVIVRVRI